MTFASARMASHQKRLTQQQGSMQTITTFSTRFTFEPLSIMQLLHHHLIGQERALHEIENMLSVIKANFNDPNKPLSVTLLLGPTGVGKTETVRIISQAIHGRADAFCRIDMNTLAQEHYAAALTGAPPGYVGSKEGHTLFNLEAIQGSYSKPGIVLFDEIEKANIDVIRALLNILDTGILKLTAGTKEIDFRNCMIFMTSNIGAKQSQARLKLLNSLPPSIKKLATSLKVDDSAITQRALMQKFDPEFLNRIDRILHYNALEQSHADAVLHIELEKLNARLGKHDRSVDLTVLAANHLVKAYDAKFGARGIARYLKIQLEPVIAHFFLNNPDVNHIRIHYIDQQLVAYSAE